MHEKRREAFADTCIRMCVRKENYEISCFRFKKRDIKKINYENWNND